MACLDTTFHADLPAIARTFPFGKELREAGIQRYGFHGLSCESIVSHLMVDSPHRPPDRLIIAHLGNGSSITAVKNGKSVDTSMGLTPTGGVIMGTWSGDLDPGVLVYLMREKNYDADQLEKLIDHYAGVLGISGVSGDLLVFTGGIGEHDERVRAAVCDDLSWIGIRLDTARNRSSNNPINETVSRCAVHVLSTREEETIARHTWILSQPRA